MKTSCSYCGMPQHNGNCDRETLKSVVLEKWTRPEDLVMDPYLGSGPVLLAALASGRQAIGIEIEEKYCEIAAKRLSAEKDNLTPAGRQTLNDPEDS